MNMETSFELSDEAEGTAMRWEADVKIAGPVGSMGQRVLQPIVNQQVQSVLNALDRQVMDAASAGASSAAPEAPQGAPGAGGGGVNPLAASPPGGGASGASPQEPPPASGTAGVSTETSPPADPQGPTQPDQG